MIDLEIEMKGFGREQPPNTHRRHAARRNQQVEEYKQTGTQSHT